MHPHLNIALVNTFAAWLLAVFVCGCSGAQDRRFQVSGQVRLNGQPLSQGGVSFMPDSARSPSLNETPSGTIANGAYTVSTAGKIGIPAGWYKVTLTASAPADPKQPYALPKSLIHTKYTTATTTDLSVEVVEHPAAGAYDFDVSP